MTVLSEHVWDYVIILKKNAMSLQCRYLCKFPASSILSSVVPQFSAQGGAGGTPWGPGVLSCFRWKLHPPSQAWPLLSTSNRGEIAIAKCGNWTLRNKPQWNFNKNTKLVIHENASESVICEMAAILSRGRWVNLCKYTDSRLVPSLWETSLLCNNISNWLGTSLEWALIL